jgi:hypothetical protein
VLEYICAAEGIAGCPFFGPPCISGRIFLFAPYFLLDSTKHHSHNRPLISLLTFEKRLAGTIRRALQIFYDAIVYVAMLNLVLLLANVINQWFLFLL